MFAKPKQSTANNLARATYGIEAIPDIIAKLGYGYVQGLRSLPGGLAANTPLERTIANGCIHVPMLSIAGRYWFTDTANGFRANSADYLCDPHPQPYRAALVAYELLFYLTVRAGQLGFKITEAAVKRHHPESGKTTSKIFGFGGKAQVLNRTIHAAMEGLKL